VNENSDSFGINLWWTVPELVVPAQQVQDLLVKHGFEKSDIKEPSDRVEVSRAVHSFQNRRTKEDRHIAEIANEQGDAVVYGILDPEHSADGDSVDFKQRTTVRYDKNTNVVSATGELADKVEAALGEYRDKVTDQDVRYFLRKVVRMCAGVSKRPTGGIYFVPALHVGVIQSAQAFLAELAVGAKLYVERVVNGEAERQIVWEAVEGDLDDQLSAVLASVDRVERRVSALRNQEARVEELRSLMKVYQELLGKEAEYEDMAAKLDAAVATIAQKMANLQSLTPPPAPVDPNAPKHGRGPSQDDYFKAVIGVLIGKPEGLRDVEIAAQIKVAFPQVVEPANIYAHLYSRSKKGLVKMVGHRKFALA
jgi:hypothetical protein